MSLRRGVRQLMEGIGPCCSEILDPNEHMTLIGLLARLI
jgi:hypothetical protein